MNQEYKFFIPAKAELVEVGTEQVEHYCKSIGFNSEESFCVQVVLAEAVNNIIEHALPNQPDEKIEICCYSDESMLIIKIVDSGTPLSSLPDANLPDWEAESGRGWPIIYSWMDEVTQHQLGNNNQLVMKKYFPTI